MGGLFKSKPAPAPAPVATPAPAPAAPVDQSAGVSDDAFSKRRLRSKSMGRGSSILSSGGGPDYTSAKRTLLGE